MITKTQNNISAMRRLSCWLIPSRTPRTFRRTCGFTFVEVVIAGMIFVVSMLGAYALIVFGFSGIRKAREVQYVTRVLETTTEAVRNLSWVELTAQPASQTFDARYSVVNLFGKSVNPSIQQHDDYESPLTFPSGSTGGTINIDTVPSEPNLRRVTVALTYIPFGAASNQTVRMTSATFVSKNGIDRR